MDVAVELAGQASCAATGRLDIATAQARAQILLREGRIAMVSGVQARPALGMRLVSGGCLSLTNLGTALNAHRQHPEMRLGDVLVRMGLVARVEVEQVAWEQMCDDVAAILTWADPTSTFSPLAPDAVPPAGPSVEELLRAAGDRARRWQAIVREIGGPDTVPNLSEDLMSAKDAALQPTDWAVLCRVDGRRSLRSIAEQAGLTLMEAASILKGLLAAGLATVPDAHLPDISARPASWPAPASMDHERPRAPHLNHAPQDARAEFGRLAAPVTPAGADAIGPTPVDTRSDATTAVPRPVPAPPPPPPPPPPPTADASWPVEQFDDPADLLRELSQLSGNDQTARRRGGR